MSMMDPTNKAKLQHLLDLAKQTNKPLVTMAALTTILEVVTMQDNMQAVIYLREHGLFSILAECLDDASDRQNNGLQDVMVMVAMKVTYHLSIMPSLVVQNLAMGTFFKRLLRFVNMEGGFFRYGKKFSDVFTSLTQDKVLVGNVCIEKLTAEERKYLLDGEIVRHSSALPKQICKCTCFDMSSDKDVNISGYMISKALAWSDSAHCSAEASTDDVLKDIIITETLTPGNYFYALVGKAAIGKIQKLSSIMEECKNDLELGKVEIGKILVVVVSRHGKREHVRAQVLTSQGDWVTVLLVDYGGIHDVRRHDVYELPSIIGLMYFPSQTTLCSLAGVRAAPKDPYVAQLALAAMCNFIRHSVSAGVNLMQADAICHLRHVVQCPDPIMVLQATRVLNNLTRNPRADHDCFEPVLLALLKMLGGLSTLTWSVVAKEDVCRCSLSCLANILNFSKDYRDLFYQNEGLSIVLNLMSQYDCKRPSYRAGIQAIRNFLYVCTPVVRNSCPPKDAIVDVTLLKDQQHPDRLSELAEFLEEECISDDDLNSTEQPQSPCDSTDTLVPETMEPETTNTSTDSSSQVVAVNCGDVGAEPGQTYLYNSAADICDDMTHEICPPVCLSQASASVAARIVCGMLNSKGGTLYYGLTKEHRVRGLRISRDARDSFRLGVDQMMMTKISPQVLYIQYELVYVPVFLKGQQKQPSLVKDLYVVELNIRASRGAVHSVAGDCCFRFGPNTLSLSTMEVRELVVVAEEDHYMDEIKNVQAQLKNMTICG